jgi:hypothetical protein
MKPRARFGCEMPPVTMTGITQKRPTRGPRCACLGGKRHRAPAGYQTADRQTPVGVPVVHDPVITFPPRHALLRLREMRHKVGGLPRRTARPDQLPGGHGPRVEQYPGATADVCVFASLAPARLCGFAWCFALQHWPAGFCLAADHQPLWLVIVQRAPVERANGVGVGRQRLGMTRQPGRTLVRFESDVWQEAPEAGAAERLGVPMCEPRRPNLISRPSRDGAILVWGSRARHRDDPNASGGGHRSWSPRARGIV